MIDEKKFNYTKQDIFGKYCKIPMCADGEKHIFKCIGVFQSNTYMDVPIYPIHEMTQHHKEFNSLEDLEWVVNVIHCGIDETKVIRVALKDIEIIEDETTEIENYNSITIVVGNQLEFETDLLKQLIKEHFELKEKYSKILDDVHDYRYETHCMKMTIRNLCEHFGVESEKELQNIYLNKPYKFEELEENMWVWDSYFHCYCYIGLIVNKNCVHIGYIDGYSSDGPFEENRFYRKQVEDND